MCGCKHCRDEAAKERREREESWVRSYIRCNHYPSDLVRLMAKVANGALNEFEGDGNKDSARFWRGHVKALLRMAAQLETIR
jgi:hypothetical protein